jgi:hypothetical protein
MDGFLTIPDLAERLGRNAQTVRRFRSDSKPGGRYAGMPFPEPDRRVGNMPVWAESRLPEIEAWLAARPGMGAGGGSPSHRKNRVAST